MLISNSPFLPKVLFKLTNMELGVIFLCLTRTKSVALASRAVLTLVPYMYSFKEILLSRVFVSFSVHFLVPR